MWRKVRGKEFDFQVEKDRFKSQFHSLVSLSQFSCYLTVLYVRFPSGKTEILYLLKIPNVRIKLVAYAQVSIVMHAYRRTPSPNFNGLMNEWKYFWVGEMSFVELKVDQFVMQSFKLVSNMMKNSSSLILITKCFSFLFCLHFYPVESAVNFTLLCFDILGTFGVCH